MQFVWLCCSSPWWVGLCHSRTDCLPELTEVVKRRELISRQSRFIWVNVAETICWWWWLWLRRMWQNRGWCQNDGLLAAVSQTDAHVLQGSVAYALVGSLTSPFSTNMAISETKGCVATRLRCDGTFNDNFITTLQPR